MTNQLRVMTIFGLETSPELAPPAGSADPLKNLVVARPRADPSILALKVAKRRLRQAQ
jgi:hypothetical protein